MKSSNDTIWNRIRDFPLEAQCLNQLRHRVLLQEECSIIKFTHNHTVHQGWQHVKRKKSVSCTEVCIVDLLFRYNEEET